MSSQELATRVVFASAMAFTPGPNPARSAVLGVARALRGALKIVGLACMAGWVRELAGAKSMARQGVKIKARVNARLMADGCASKATDALVGSAGRHWLAHGRRPRMFNRVLAAAFVITAGWMDWL